MAMKTAIVEELQELIAIEKAEENSMDEAQKACEDLIKEEEYQAALERGEKFAPDGRLIPENQNIEIRPLDPRFNPAFGNPFFRVNNIEKKEDEAISELSEAELEFFNSLEDEDLLLEEDDEGVDFGDTYDQFVASEEVPRGRCGLDVQDAIDTCGSACDPDVESCLITNNHGSAYNQLNINNQWFVQGTCFPDLLCFSEGDLQATLNGDPCAAKKFNNPCPNPCDCHKSAAKREKCHGICASLESRDILQCMKLRASGNKKRERKVLKAILEEDACEYNVHFVHPLMGFTEVSGIDLPGLFETF
jgi:predicted transcriptional regulator